MEKVFDAQALMVYLLKEQGFQKVQDELIFALRRNQKIFMSLINWGEVYYQIYRRNGADQAEATSQFIESLPIKIIKADYQLTKEAARFKASYQLSYADCFAAALAKLYKAQLMTGDPEFKAVVKEVKIFWLPFK